MRKIKNISGSYRQSAKNRLSSPLKNKKSSGRRAKHVLFRFGRTRYDLSLRKFSTNPAKRTKKTNQKVIKLYALPYKELALSKFTYKAKKSLLPAYAPKVAGATLSVVGLLGILYFGTHLTGYSQVNIANSPHSQVKAASVSVPASKSMPASAPMQIIIPKINVDAQIIPTGLKTDGSLDVPADYHIAGWYNKSPTPGQIGPSIIDGHVDNHEGLGVFWNLRELAPGDTFQVVRADGSTATFKVSDIKQIPQSNFPTSEIYGPISYAGIRLITCGGAFNSDTHHYTDNIVVFGVLI